MKRVLGKIDDIIIDKYGIEEHRGKNIVIYPDKKQHAKDRHIHEYDREEDFYIVSDSLQDIISNPDYVYYDEDKVGLEFYKNINGNILVAVGVQPGHELKVRSFYPINETKIDNRKNKELLEMYSYKPNTSNIKLDLIEV